MGEIYLNCFFLCLGFLALNLFKVGLKGKSILIPSTVFAFMWGLTSLGCYLYINKIVGNSSYYHNATYLSVIGEYQFNILLTCFSAFLLVRFLFKDKPFISVQNLKSIDILPFFISKLRWILYLLFVLGMFRLIMVLYATGFDYYSIRNYYIIGRASYTSFDLNLIRITSYVLQLVVFYIVLLGLNSAISGLKIKEILKSFVLFMPFQLSFGGRLFILSFFIPFFLSFFLFRLMPGSHFYMNKNEKKKLFSLIVIPILLIVLFQIVKLGNDVNTETMKDNSNELFYTSSSYMHMNELWRYLPADHELGYGRNIIPIIGTPSPIYETITAKWRRTYNSASVCVPSMIPGMYLDFGYNFSLIVYFIIFFLLEHMAFSAMRKFSFKRIMIFILLCLFAFSTTASKMADSFRTLIVGLILISFLSKYLQRRN